MQEPSKYAITHGSTPEELRALLRKYDQEAAVCIDPNGDVSFDCLEESKRHRIPRGKAEKNLPSIRGFPVTFQEGDKVTLPDSREGIVLGSVWIEDLTLYRYNNEPRIGYFLVKVDFGDHTELLIRNDLKGSRFRYL